MDIIKQRRRNKMATSSFTNSFKLPCNAKAIKAFVKLLEEQKTIEIKCNISSKEEKESREKLLHTLASL